VPPFSEGRRQRPTGAACLRPRTNRLAPRPSDRDPVTVNSPGPFFVAGTGRSGTSQLTRVIGEHPAVYSLGWETRFIVDPGGFEDLVPALTERYTPYHADDALRRLFWLLEQRLAGRTMEVFHGWDLPGEIGEVRYWRAVDGLRAKLTWYSFDEVVPKARPASGPEPTAEEGASAKRRTVARYFTDRAELVAIVRRFVEELFGSVASAAGKSTWCEKTPFNLLSVPFLWDLFPEATVIVAVRDPRAVVASHLEQIWAPSTLDDVLSWLEPVYRRWMSEREALLADRRYVEVRIDDLAADWPSQRAAPFGRMGLADHETRNGFDRHHVHHRDGALTLDELAVVDQRIGWAARTLGY
jgi:omega-hydroxy-beta-dihydromenaquinone-9 sulfotransferase